ncbi:MAG: hypothetical protein JNL82_19800 [Myxococcales bacterium]|nr:hypothetical protein [Myxococcales bacterium]
MPQPTREEEFHALLTDLFAADDLRAFIGLGPEGHDIAASLPAPASAAELAAAAIERLRQRGRISDSFERLLQRFPARRADIFRVAARWSSASAERAPALAPRDPAGRAPSLRRAGAAAAVLVLAATSAYLGVAACRSLTAGAPVLRDSR